MHNRHFLKTSSIRMDFQTSAQWFSQLVVAVGTVLAVGSSPAAAQKLEVGGHFTGLRLSEFDATDLGRTSEPSR